MAELIHRSHRLWDLNYSKEVDTISIKKYQISEIDLMEQAGTKAAEVTKALLLEDHHIYVLAGPGNNGGDALVVARLLVQHGKEVTVWLVKSHDRQCSSSCSVQIELLKEAGCRVLTWQQGALKKFREENPAKQCVVVDGLLGIGFKPPLEDGVFKQCLVEASRITPDIVVAVDIPSGFHADDWSTDEALLRPTHTVTFGYMKPVHCISPSRRQCGIVICSPIGFHKGALKEAFPRKPLVVVDEVAALKNDPRHFLDIDAHKYVRGHSLIIGGSYGKAGAPIMSGLACLRAGAGWASIALGGTYSSAPLDLTYESFFSQERLHQDDMLEFLKNRKVRSLVIGPGTMQNCLDRQLLDHLAEFTWKRGLFLVIDAGCLQEIMPMIRQTKFNPEKVVLTPHPGEWGRMGFHGDMKPSSIDQIEKIKNDLKVTGVNCLYKSATPLFISAKTSDPTFAFLGGSHALAKAGTGDILCGIISALGGMGLRATDAVILAMSILHRASDSLIRKRGLHSLLPTDLISEIS